MYMSVQSVLTLGILTLKRTVVEPMMTISTVIMLKANLNPDEDLFILKGKGKGQGKSTTEKGSKADSPTPASPATMPVISVNNVLVGRSRKDKSPDHNDPGGDGLTVNMSEYTVNEFPKRNSENPANDYHSAKRRDGDAEPILAKRLGVDYVGAISENQFVNIT